MLISFYTSLPLILPHNSCIFFFVLLSQSVVWLVLPRIDIEFSFLKNGIRAYLHFLNQHNSYTLVMSSETFISSYSLSIPLFLQFGRCVPQCHPGSSLHHDGDRTGLAGGTGCCEGGPALCWPKPGLSAPAPRI